VSPTDERIARLEAQVEMLLATVEAQAATINAQAAEIVELKRRLGENSSNSNKPPSSDPPKQQQARQQQRKKSKRRRGGQPGHGGHHRELVPVEQVNAVVECHPPRCLGCRQRLFPIPDATPLRHQVTEVPVRDPHVTEVSIRGTASHLAGLRAASALDGGRRLPDARHATA
jgi:transposase